MKSATAAAAPAPPDFRETYEAYFARVWRTLRRLGVREGDLSDAAQEVFVIVHRRFDDFDASRPMGPWLAGIAHRVAAAERRRARHKRERLTEAHVLADRADPRPDPEAAAATAQRRRRVYDALDALDDDHRVVFVLHEMEGLPCPQIAKTLGVNVNTVYSRLRSAQLRFRAAIRRLRLRKGEA